MSIHPPCLFIAFACQNIQCTGLFFGNLRPTQKLVFSSFLQDSGLWLILIKKTLFKHWIVSASCNNYSCWRLFFGESSNWKLIQKLLLPACFVKCWPLAALSSYSNWHGNLFKNEFFIAKHDLCRESETRGPCKSKARYDDGMTRAWGVPPLTDMNKSWYTSRTQIR